MSIIAKIVRQDGRVEDKSMESDPSDADLGRALGGTGSDPRTEIATIGEWEVHGLDLENGDYLVIGAAPFISDQEKTRLTCDLSDDLVRQLCKVVRSLLSRVQKES